MKASSVSASSGDGVVSRVSMPKLDTGASKGANMTNMSSSRQAQAKRSPRAYGGGGGGGGGSGAGGGGAQAKSSPRISPRTGAATLEEAVATVVLLAEPENGSAPIVSQQAQYVEMKRPKTNLSKKCVALRRCFQPFTSRSPPHHRTTITTITVLPQGTLAT